MPSHLMPSEQGSSDDGFQTTKLPSSPDSGQGRRMRISFEGRLGLILALIGLAGAGIVIVRPDLHIVGWFLIAIAAAGAILLAGHHFSELWSRRNEPSGRRKMIAFGGMIVCGIGLLGFGAWYFSPAKAKTPTTVAAATETDSPALAAQATPPPSPALPSDLPSNTIARTEVPKPLAPSDPQIRLIIECMMAGGLAAVPDDGIAYSLAIFQPDVTPSAWGLNILRSKPGTPLYDAKTTPFRALMSKKCVITNYSEVPLIDVDIILSLTFYNAHKDGDATRITTVSSHQTHPFRIGKIDPGVKNGFVFYADNYSGLGVDLEMPKTVSAVRIDEGTRVNLPLISAGDRPARLFPWIETTTP